MLRVALEKAGASQSCTGAGGTVGQPESAAAHWLPASPRVTRSAPMAWALRARAPVAAESLPRATRSAPKAGALRARAPTCAPRVTAHVVSWGGVGMSKTESKTSCAARCSRGSVQGVLRAPAEGEGGVAHREDLLLPPPPPRSSGAPVRWLMARGRRASGVGDQHGLVFRSWRRATGRLRYDRVSTWCTPAGLSLGLLGSRAPSTTYTLSRQLLSRALQRRSPATEERSLKLASTATDS